MLEQTGTPQLGCCDGCSQRSAHGMGATDSESSWLRNLLPVPVNGDWIQPLGTIALAAIAAYLAYKMLFGSRAKNRRGELAEARKDYSRRVSEIKGKWAY